MSRQERVRLLAPGLGALLFCSIPEFSPNQGGYGYHQTNGKEFLLERQP
jgi:hypothetical protein